MNSDGYRTYGFALPLLVLGATGQICMAQSAQTRLLLRVRLTTRREFHGGVVDQQRKVLVTGGGSDSGDLATAELYDPVAGTFTATHSMVIARANHTATLLPDGRVLIAGGNPLIARAELYDPSTETFTATGPMIEMRILHTMTQLSTEAKYGSSEATTRYPASQQASVQSSMIL